MKQVEEFLRNNIDEKYADFQRKLVPNVDAKTILGVRTPILRKYAKEFYRSGNYKDFLKELPHKYFDENQLHSSIICEIKDFNECLNEVEKFLPFVNNWATCDQLSPKIFRKHCEELKSYILHWIKSDKEYTVRFGIEIGMTYFLDENFDENLMEEFSKIRASEYYVKMMVAWYFATALAKQWDKTIFYIQNKKLESWTHNKAIQKARESYRITKEQKTLLQSLKV